MAVDKLVDSTQLDADLTSVANAIRTKGGTSAQMAFPAGFVSAVQAIPTGGGESALGEYAASLARRWEYAIFDEAEDFVVDCSNVYRYEYNSLPQNRKPPEMEKAFSEARRLKSITIKNMYTDGTSIQSMGSFAIKSGYYGSFSDNLESVSFEGATIVVGAAVSAFEGRTKLKVIDAVFDMSKVPSYASGYNFANMFRECSALEEIRFVPNSLLWMNTSYQIFNVSQVLSDTSLVSIANALAVGSAAPNIKLLSTPYARCSTLMGTVTDGLFTQDDVSGTVSLADFIANTKGWTLST